MRIPEEIKNKIISLYPEKTVGEIAKLLNVHRTTVSKVTHWSGLKVSNPLSDIQEKFILENYPKMSVSALSRVLDISRDKITVVLKSNNVEIVSNKIVFTEEQVKTCKELYKTKTLEEIASIMGCTRPVIANLLKSNNVKINSEPFTLNFTDEQITLISYLTDNNIMLRNQIASMFGTSINVIKSRYIKGLMINGDLLTLLVSNVDKFKTVYDDYNVNKNTLTDCREYSKNLSKNVGITLATFESMMKIIDPDFYIYCDIAINKKIYDLYYNQKLSTIKIGEIMKCPTHIVNDIMHKNNMPINNTYYYATSNPENEIRDFLMQHISSIEPKSCRKILGGRLEIDIIDHKFKIGVEFDGLYFHSIEQGKSIGYHLDKTNKMNEKGYGLVHVFQDEFLLKPDVVKSRLLNVFGHNVSHNYDIGNSNIIKINIDDDVLNFIDNNSLELIDIKINDICYGCYYDNSLLSVMLFEHVSNNNFILKLFCTDIKYKIDNIERNLLKQFINDYKPTEIISFADKRWVISKDNNIYVDLGFKLDKETKPNGFWFKRNNRFKLEKITKKYLSITDEFKSYYDKNKTEVEMMHEANYLRIYDCGLFRYKLTL